MDPWQILENKINNAKDKALETDRALLKSAFSRCKECGGRVSLMSNGSYKCNVCGKEELSDKDKVKNALRENGSLTAREISRITGVPRDEINAFLDDGILEISSDSKVRIRCKICNKVLTHGTVCPNCKTTYKDEFGDVNVRVGNTLEKQRTTNKKFVSNESNDNEINMHYLNYNNKRKP